MDIRPDMRHYAYSAHDARDSHANCRKCGTPIVVLPDDRRHGFCFDCTDLLDTPASFEVKEGRFFSPCGNNGFY